MTTATDTPNKAQLPCPYCGQQLRLVWVHGHGQCASCKTNVDECCRGENCETNINPTYKISKP